MRPRFVSSGTDSNLILSKKQHFSEILVPYLKTKTKQVEPNLLIFLWSLSKNVSNLQTVKPHSKGGITISTL